MRSMTRTSTESVYDHELQFGRNSQDVSRTAEKVQTGASPSRLSGCSDSVII
jgi:hypothetical protein